MLQKITLLLDVSRPQCGDELPMTFAELEAGLSRVFAVRTVVEINKGEEIWIISRKQEAREP